jgi:5'-nucleotidase
VTRVLITNDDGIDSPGLHALANGVVSTGFELIVAAPAVQYSGASASILGAEENGTIRFERRELEQLPGITAYAVQAAPALISLVAAHGAFGPPPDLVLSGINRGANVGRAILHSGTVGAALTAGVNGARGIAVSLDVGMDPLECYWEVALPHVAALIPLVMDQPPGTVFNLNVPNEPERAAELREGPLASFGIVQATTLGTGDDTRLSVADTPADQAPESDAALLAEGYATVTSIQPVTEAATPALRTQPAR